MLFWCVWARPRGGRAQGGRHSSKVYHVFFFPTRYMAGALRALTEGPISTQEQAESLFVSGMGFHIGQSLL